MNQSYLTIALSLSATLTVAYAAAAGDKAKVTILAPQAGVRWEAGCKQVIAWEIGKFAAFSDAQIEFSSDGGKQWKPIVGVRKLKGEYLWQAPNAVSEKCRVRVREAVMGLTAETPDFAIVAAKPIPEYAWELVTAKAAFAPRDGAGALTFQGRMWFLGGWNPGDRKHFPRICNNEVWSSADGKNWRLDKPNTFLDKSFDRAKDWEGRHTAGYAVHQNKMWIVGGDVNQGYYQSDVWSTSDGKSWANANPGKPVPWGPRALHYTLTFKDKIWVIGGQTIPTFAKEKEAFYRDVWNSADGVHWTEVKPKEPFWPQRGMIGGAAVLNDRMWILGGGTYDTPRNPTRLFYSDVWSSADGIDWKQHTAFAPWEPRQYHDVAVFDNRLWVMEGYYKANRNDVWHSADGVNWYEVPKTPWRPRHAASVFVHDGALWMVAGNNMESDVWKLTRKKR